MKKIILFVFTVALAASVLTGGIFYAVLRHDKSATGVVAAAEESKNYVLAGLDKAGDNTDMLMLVSVSSENDISFMQIPRDTYLRTEDREGKINQLFRHCSAEGETSFLATLSEAFSIPLHGYVVFRLEAVAETVDVLGGVPITLNEDFIYTDDATGEKIVVKKGTRLLDGRDACGYIRHRASYAEGDLGRLDAQMRFFSSAFATVAKLKDPFAYVRLYRKIAPKLLTNLSERDIITLATAFLKNRGGESVCLTRLPGEATRGERGSWYYVANRKATEQLIREYFCRDRAYRFDEKQAFTRKDRENFMNIYNDLSCESKIYTLAEASKIKIIKK